jgi:hypothetical protein
MDLDQFEQYAIHNGYEIYEYKKEENSNGVCYAKGDFKQRRYITLFEFFNDYGRYVVFNTAISSELLAIKNQMKKSGYRLSKSYFVNDYKADEYKKNNYQVVIFTKPPNEEIDHVIYEIGFRKL